MTAEKFLELRKDIDMAAHLDKADPPLHFSPGSKGQGVHSHRFVEALRQRAKRTGANLVIAEGRERLIHFLTARLKAAPTTAACPAD